MSVGLVVGGGWCAEIFGVVVGGGRWGGSENCDFIAEKKVHARQERVKHGKEWSTRLSVVCAVSGDVFISFENPLQGICYCLIRIIFVFWRNNTMYVAINIDYYYYHIFI